MSKPTAKWEVTAKGLAKKAIKDQKLLAELLQGILSKEDETRYTSFKALLFLSGEHPELVYPHWDHFAELVNSENTHSKYIASYLIASLTVVDADNRFEEIFDKYYNLLNDRSIIPAAHVAANSGKIAKAKPELQAEITEKLLSIDKTRHEPYHKELIKSEAIEAFNDYFDQTKDEDKEKIVEFVKRQLKSKSPKTEESKGIPEEMGEVRHLRTETQGPPQTGNDLSRVCDLNRNPISTALRTFIVPLTV